MTILDCLIAAFVIFIVAYVSLGLMDMWDAHRVSRCLRIIEIAVCPRCKQTVGTEGASKATQTHVKFGTVSGRKLRGRDYPYRLVTVACPHCTAELQFRLNGSLFSCNREVVAV